MARKLSIQDLLDYWVDLSKRSDITLSDYKVFLDRRAETFAHFAELFGWYRPRQVDVHADLFFRQVHSGVFSRQTLWEAAQRRGELTEHQYATMKDVARKFVTRIRKNFGLSLVHAQRERSPLQDAEAILQSSTKLTHKWAAGIITANHLATILIKLCEFKKGERYKDDINTLYAQLKNRTKVQKLKAFLTRSYRRFEDADKMRNRCAHVNEGEPTKQETNRQSPWLGCCNGMFDARSSIRFFQPILTPELNSSQSAFGGRNLCSLRAPS